MADPIRDNVALSRFELDLDAGVAVVTYRLLPGAITLVHTEVPAEVRGSGVGSDFVGRVLEQVRRRGLKMVPQCSFVRAFMAKNLQFNDLLY
jgi:uncharacterized protein